MTDIPTMRDFHKYMDICRVCFEPMCLRPECLAQGCQPLKKKIDAAENEAYKRSQNRKMMGL